MKLAPLCYSRARALMIVLLLLMGTTIVSAQGWVNWSGINVGEMSRHDVIDVLDFIDGQAVFVNYGNRDGGDYLTFGKIWEYGAGGQSINGPDDLSSTISYIPTSGVNETGNTFYVLFNRFDSDQVAQSIYLIRYDREDQDDALSMTWHRPLYELAPDYATAGTIINTGDGHLVATGQVAADLAPDDQNIDLVLIKADLEGNVIWSNILVSEGGDEPVAIIAAADGGYWILKQNTALLPTTLVTTWLVKVDEFGEVTSETQLTDTDNDDPRAMIQAADGTFVISGQTAVEEAFVLKIDTDGNEIWRTNYVSDTYTSQANAVMEDSHGALVAAGNLTYLADDLVHAFIAKLDNNGTPLWERDYPRGENAASFDFDTFNDLVEAPSGGYVMGGARARPDGLAFSLVVKTDTFGIINGGSISGNVYNDLDLDCTADADDVPLAGWLITATSTTRTYTDVTDAAGNYELPVEVLSGTSGEYTVSVVPPSPYWGACEQEVAVSIPYLDAVTVDFPMQVLVECPFVQPQVSSFGSIRLCDTTAVVVQYCNDGTALAENAYVELTFPDELTPVDFTLPPSEIVGQTYTFELGDLPIGSCGSLTVFVTTECDEELLGQSVCIDAHAYPDEICEVPGQAWSGALVNARYTCEDGNLQFALENVGAESMVGPLEYVIIEDAVLLMEGTFDLGPAQEALPDLVPQNGSTYTLIAQQEPGAPGAELLSIGASACPNEGSTELNEFAQYGGNPFQVTYCTTIIGAYDPNDKQATPAGFGEDHGISANTPINYTIRFQNTGTDTAFRVVIRDTLSPFLNPATLRPGPSSHLYEWHFEDEALVFRFPNIELPDSNANLAASQGFVTFRIDQDDQLPAGTRIENSAGIYFDFNSPIITNTVFHTVVEFIDIVSGSVSVTDPAFAVSVAPNPMYDAARIHITGLPPGENQLNLQLYDAAGQAVRRISGDAQGFWLQRGNLPSGLYFFTISGESGRLASGKVSVQ